MRILIDASCWENRRGFGRFSRELITALVAGFGDQHEFILLTDALSAGRCEFPANARVVPVKTQEQPIQAASSTGARSLTDMLRFGRAVSAQNADVCFFPAPYTYFPILDKTPMVICIHDAMTEAKPEWFFSNLAARWRWKAKLWLALRQANKIMCPSEQARKDVSQAFDLPVSSIERIDEAAAPGFAPLDDDQAIKTVLARYDISSGLPIVLYVGGISPHKNLDGLVHAMGRLKSDAQLVIVGDEKRDSYLICGQELRETIARLGLSERVSFTGFVPDDDLVAIYNAATLLVLPSFDEGFGLPVIEAMACGTPVAVSQIGALMELAGKAGLVFDPGNLDDMASAIDRLLQSDALRETLRHRGQERVRHYSWRRAAEQTMSVLLEAGMQGSDRKRADS
jgi:glycosyltransferase involved in cell wall biosynthesis